jgi:UDP-N-acetylglucosamine 2-epimerase (non-hydrolysing)
MKVVSVFGTRPEMIKLWSTLKKLDDLNFEHIMVHTGQNFTPELKDFFFRDLKMRRPDYELRIDTSSYAKEVADVIVQSDELFEKIKPDALLILGDTYSGLSVMPAAQRGIKSYHMEAGMRAYDSRMPEQRNRVLIDHASTYNFPFNRYHRENLLRENIHPSRIFVSGNPTFEVMRAFEKEISESEILSKLNLQRHDYFVVTAHRSENVDNAANLNAIMQALSSLSRHFGKAVVYPMHPRTKSKLGQFESPPGVIICAPLGFYDFNKLVSDSSCIISDSGTAPEESYFYKVPCVSLRTTTERFETLEGGAHILAGLDVNSIVDSVITACSQPWSGRYDLEENFSPSSVVVNCMRSRFNQVF